MMKVRGTANAKCAFRTHFAVLLQQAWAYPGLISRGPDGLKPDDILT